jgi:hypothetical protein
MRAGKRRFLLISIVLFGMPAAVLPATAVAAPAPEQVTLQICRMAGLGSETPSPITIPAGTSFDDKDTALLAQPELETSGPANVAAPTQVVLITTAALSLPQNRYCADVAAKPAAGTTDKALNAAAGRLFAVAGHDQLSLLGEVYASFKAAQTSAASGL